MLLSTASTLRRWDSASTNRSALEGLLLERAEGSEAPRAAERSLPLEGAFNLRDLGGYPARDGRVVRWRSVFRSGVLCYLSEADRIQALRLGVRVICDLRRADERRQEPTLWPELTAQIIHWDEDTDAAARKSLNLNTLRTEDEARRVMLHLYRNLPIWLNARLRALFQRLIQGDVPLLFHCAAGKDRTGVAAALLLTALGVPREVVIEDYVLTNHTGNLEGLLALRLSTQSALGVVSERAPALVPEVRRPLLNADPDYLNAALEQIESAHGTIERFLSRELDVGRRERDKLADLLLV